MSLWRVFPWDWRAAGGAPHSAEFVPSPTGRGRFDLARNRSSALYLAEYPEHAVGEVLVSWRGRRIRAAHLRYVGLPLSLVEVTFGNRLAGEMADLCEPETLSSLGIQPDHVASRSRWTTQPIAAAVWDRGFSGLRWWSSFWGEWHTTIVFTRRAANQLTYGMPERLTLESPPLIEACRLLGIEIA